MNKLCIEARIVLVDRSSLGKLEDGLMVLNHQHVLWVRAGGRQWLSQRRGRPDKRNQLSKGIIGIINRRKKILLILIKVDMGKGGQRRWIKNIP